MGITPLDQLLAHLANGEIHSLTELADHLGSSVSLVEMMLRDLERGGYVQTQVNGCGNPCAGCQSASTCSSLPGARIWSVTERGFRHVAGAQSS